MTSWGHSESPSSREVDTDEDKVRDSEHRAVASSAALIPGIFDFNGILVIADALPVMIAYVDRDLTYRFVNRLMADWYERERSGMLGQPLPGVMGAATFEARRERLEAALDGERQVFTAPFEHPTRGTLMVHADYVPHRVDDGPVQGIILLIQDVTEQHAAEAAIRESEQRFRRISDSAPVPMWVTRIDGSRDFVNQAYHDFFGFPPDARGQHDWQSAIHPDDKAVLIERYTEALDDKKPVELLARFRRADGEWRWMRSVSMPRTDEDGRVIGFIGAASDITEAKESELALQQLVEKRTADLAVSEARFRAIFDTVKATILLCEPDGTILASNQTGRDWRVTKPSTEVGRKLWATETVRPEHVDTLKQMVADAAAGREAAYLFEVVGPTGKLFSLDVDLRPIVEEGQVRYLLCEARDVSELKQAQDQLRQAQKMEALGQLTGGIAHDFNNLLTVVVGGLDLISKRVEDDRLQRYAQNALSAAERGARLTGQLLAFSRVQRLEVRPCYVAPLVEEMAPLLRNVLGPGIEKKYDLDPHLMPVMADPTQLEVAVLNLAINARDAMPEGGTLTISSRRWRMAGDREVEDGDYVELSIADTGQGMPPEVMARAFEPFFTTKEVGKGTGLGLSMVYGMARQSGGTARIDSTPGVGTTVRLYFRRAKGGEKAVDSDGERQHAKGRKSKNLSILVIDDDDDVRGFIASSLEEYGHHVSECGEAAAGVAEFAKVRPDLVVIDYIMPGMTGAEVAARILADTPGQPILFVSGYSETEAIRAVAPDAPLLTKPFRPSALDAAVRSLMETRRSK